MVLTASAFVTTAAGGTPGSGKGRKGNGRWGRLSGFPVAEGVG